MRGLREIAVVSLLNFRSLKQRVWQSLVIVVGMTCVIGVLLSMLSMTEGMNAAYVRNGDPIFAIVVAKGTDWEMNSSLPRDSARMVMDAAGIAKSRDGSPLADPGIMAVVPASLRKNDARSAVMLRGFGDKGESLRPTFRLVSGRMFRPGTRELIAGTGAQFQFNGMALGDKVILPNGEWSIVGTFATGDVLDGQLVGDTATLMPAIRRQAYNSVLVRLTSLDAFAAFRKALTTNPALSVDVMRLPDWNTKISSGFTRFFHVIVYGIGIILAIGAVFGCFNIMYAAVESRGREIATLRALGYGAFPIALSVMLEAALLSVAGALAGAAIAWSLYDGVQSGFGSDVYMLTVSPALIGIAVLWAIAVAVLGGLWPAIQAGRWTVADALRAV
jgi:putative ABC transport system permease protein